MKYILSLFIIFSFFQCAEAQQIKVVNYSQLEQEFKASGDSLTLVNFWATWCGPCVEEMKYFIQAQDEYKDKPLKFLYVSLDFVKQKEKVEQFVKQKGLKGNTVILKDDPNIYISKVDKNWDGSIPITLIFKKDNSKVMHSAAFDNYEELKQFIKTQF